MYKETTEQKEVKVRRKYCDVCGNEINYDLACTSATCGICGDDLCEDCIGHEIDTSGDYRSVRCKNCWSIGEKYRPEIKELEARVQKLYDAWYKECGND